MIGAVFGGWPENSVDGEGARLRCVGKDVLADEEHLRFDVLIAEAIDGQERMRLACAC